MGGETQAPKIRGKSSLKSPGRSKIFPAPPENPQIQCVLHTAQHYKTQCTPQTAEHYRKASEVLKIHSDAYEPGKMLTITPLGRGASITRATLGFERKEPVQTKVPSVREEMEANKEDRW